VVRSKKLFFALALVSAIPLALSFSILVSYLLAIFILTTNKIPPGQGILFNAINEPYYVSVKVTPITRILCYLLGVVSSIKILRRFRR